MIKVKRKDKREEKYRKRSRKFTLFPEHVHSNGTFFFFIQCIKKGGKREKKERYIER